MTAGDLFGRLEAEYARVVAERSAGPWKPGLHKPVEFDLARVAFLAPGLSASRARKLMDELAATGKLTRPFPGRLLWRMAGR